MPDILMSYNSYIKGLSCPTVHCGIQGRLKVFYGWQQKLILEYKLKYNSKTLSIFCGITVTETILFNVMTSTDTFHNFPYVKHVH